ncbi:putative reverse transcriptase domain-containing protein [Tanacetum coccineum]|uniref:Reverse transcriptase domain-containing protein n=1 Tax=Tanacetum coccineum TaxID=301880 RepID=A0ABQ4Z3I6_9ASTR
MSNSEDSPVTYTEVSSLFEDLSDIGSSGVIVHGYDVLPVMPEDPYAYLHAAFQAPPSPDYVPGPEEPHVPPPPGFVPEHVYPEFMPLEDEVFPAEEQPLPAAASPTAESPGYVLEFDPEEDPEEDDEDPEEDPADYPTDRDNDDDEEPSGDDADDEERMRRRRKLKARRLCPTHVERLLSLPTTPPSLLTSLSSPLPQIPSPPLPVSPLPPPASPTHPLGYRAVMIWLRAEAPSTSHSLPPSIILSHTRASETPPSGTPPLLPIPLPTSSPPLLLTFTDSRANAPEVTLPPQKRLCIALGSRFEVDDEIKRNPEREMMVMGLPTLRMRCSWAFQGHQLLMRQSVSTAVRDCSFTSNRPHQTGIVHRGTKTTKETIDPDDRKMAPKRTTRSGPATTTTITSVTDAQLKAMIDQGVTVALAARDRNTNSDDSHVSGTRVRRIERVTRCYNMGGILVRTVGLDVAYAMTWTDLKKKMTNKYFPKNEMKKLESELRNLKSDRIERYAGGLPDMIHRSVVASRPKTTQEAIEMATELMDKKICTFAERQTETKRKQDDNQQQQQQQNKRQNTDKAYTARTGEKKPYGGFKPLCSKCNYHHNGPCAPKCHKCNRVGHLARDCRRHFKRECPKLKNNNHGNQVRNANAPANVYAVGHEGTNPNSNVVTCTFLLNNRYASLLFDTGADKSFVSTAFSSQIDITPTTLDHYYDVELADGRIIGTVGLDVAYAMTWTDLKKKMTNKYFPKNEMKKLESELRNLKSDRIERNAGGLPDMIHKSVVASRPKTTQEAIEMATELMDKKICTFAECQTETKRKQDDNHHHQQQQQQQNKRQNTDRAYTARTGVLRILMLVTIRGALGQEYANAPQPEKKVYAVGHAGTNPDSNVVTVVLDMTLDWNALECVVFVFWTMRFMTLFVLCRTFFNRFHKDVAKENPNQWKDGLGLAEIGLSKTIPVTRSSEELQDKAAEVSGEGVSDGEVVVKSKMADLWLICSDTMLEGWNIIEMIECLSP